MILTFLRRLYIQCSTRSLRLLLWGHTVKFEGRRNLGRTHPRWSLWSVAPHIKKGKRRQSDHEIRMQNVFKNCASNAQSDKRGAVKDACMHVDSRKVLWAGSGRNVVAVPSGAQMNSLVQWQRSASRHWLSTALVSQSFGWALVGLIFLFAE